MKKLGIIALILAAGVGESWLSIIASIMLFAFAFYALGESHERS